MESVVWRLSWNGCQKVTFRNALLGWWRWCLPVTAWLWMFLSQLWNQPPGYHRRGCTGDFKMNRESNPKTPSQNSLLVKQTQRHLQTRSVLCKYCNFHLPSCISKLLEMIILNPDDCEIELIYNSVPLSGNSDVNFNQSCGHFLFILVSVLFFYFQYIEQYICSIYYKYDWLDISDMRVLLENVHWLVSIIYFILLFS